MNTPLAKLRYVNLYCNNACNSRCTICDFWRMDQEVMLRVEDIAPIVSSGFADEKTWFAIQGGEFSLHPQADAILELVRDKSFILFTNLLAPQKIIQLIKRHAVPFVTVSLDGGKQGYQRIRGVDGFKKVTQSLLVLKELTTVSVGITISPLSTFEDYLAASGFCLENDIPFGINYYTQSKIYDSNLKVTNARLINQVAEHAQDPFSQAYVRWQRDELDLPCHSIKHVASIDPKGNLWLCHDQSVILGNIRESAFDAIWAAPRTRALHQQYQSCNACFTSCYRGYDFEASQVVV